MRTNHLPCLAAALSCLLLLPSCIFFNTGGWVRAQACSYVSVDVSRPKDGEVYVHTPGHSSGKVYFQAPEVTYKERPYPMYICFMGSSITPVEDVADTGAYRWVCMDEVWYKGLSLLDEDKAKRGRCPRWNDGDVSPYSLRFRGMQEAPTADFLAACRKETATPHAAPLTAEELDPHASRKRMGAWYPAAFIASLPLSVLDVGLDVIGSVVGATHELIVNPSLK